MLLSPKSFAARGRFISLSVAMATNDKHCQTFVAEKVYIEDRVSIEYAMIYDETVEVNAQEIESPESSEEDVDEVKGAMSKFNPPVRRTARHDFESDSETESEVDFLDNISGEEESPDPKPLKQLEPEKPLKQLEPEKPEKPAQPAQLPRQPSKDSTTAGRVKSAKKRVESSNSDTDSAELDPERPPGGAGAGAGVGAGGGGRKRAAGGVVFPTEGAYDPNSYQDLKVPTDIENLFQYIMKYTPQKIDIDFKLQPFVPEYVPAVGDIDAFLKVTTPLCNVRGQPLADHVLEHIDNLGLTVLDEPAAEQSDSALLHLQLRAISKTNSAKSTVLTKKIENAEKNTKAIDRWIKDVSELHLSKPAPTVSYASKMPDIDTLMEEWPDTIEETLNDTGFPPPTLDCSLSQYVDVVCGVFDIPIAGDTLNDRIQALHLLFSVFSAVKNNQLFEERQKDVG